MRLLLDANVLIALTDINHASHQRATEWFGNKPRQFATCPITQGALVRYVLRTKSGTVQTAKELVGGISSLPGHEFWADAASFSELPEKGVQGHLQVTDAYLVLLARHHKGGLATFDRTLESLHGKPVTLIS